MPNRKADFYKCLLGKKKGARTDAKFGIDIGKLQKVGELVDENLAVSLAQTDRKGGAFTGCLLFC